MDEIMATRSGQRWWNAIYAKLSSNLQELGHLHNHQVSELADVKQQLRAVQATIRALAAAPVMIVVCGGGSSVVSGLGSGAVTGTGRGRQGRGGCCNSNTRS